MNEKCELRLAGTSDDGKSLILEYDRHCPTKRRCLGA
jgi:hypothetical protein